MENKNIKVKNSKSTLQDIVMISVKEISRLPKPLLIYSLYNENLSLKEPLSVSIEYDGKNFIAYNYDLDIFGYGETETEAIDDLRKTIVDLYLQLKNNEYKLHARAQNIWKYLESIIRENK